MGVSPIISPNISSPSLNTTPTISRQLSAASIQSIADLFISASSSASLRPAEAPVEVVKAEGLKHSHGKLRARLYKIPEFASKLLEIIQTLQIPTWIHKNKAINSEDIVIHRISGALTNAVFLVSCKAQVKTRKLLLRIYGASSGSLISRPRELHILHKLSSVYHIGPQVYGTFENGRIEEYFESTTLTADDIRDHLISRWIGARMAEFHSVDITVVSPSSDHSQDGWEIGVKKNVASWISAAHDVLSLPSINSDVRKELDLSRFEEEWKLYLKWLANVDDIRTGSRRVFAHNDTQYGNLLRLNRPIDGIDAHRQIIVVDFEYATPNPASFDIANHFHEWTANYHIANPHVLDSSRYPTLEERRNFYISYIQHTTMVGEDPVLEGAELDQLVSALDYQVRIWSPASHAMWAIWGIVQAREDVEHNNPEPEFDYIGYARGRMSGFRREIRDLGCLSDN